MNLPRIFLDAPLAPGNVYELPEAPRHHLINVLRLAMGDRVVAFNGREPHEATATLCAIDRRCASILVERSHPVTRESPLPTTLVQAVCAGERMDYAIQKATELGVTSIQPVYAERGHPPLRGERLVKKCQHWHGIALSACEQSGRVILPSIATPIGFTEYLSTPPASPRVLLDPQATRSVADIPLETNGVALLIGPESGWSSTELGVAASAGVVSVSFGPRILRCETAGPAFLAWCQVHAGDLGAGQPAS
ncbi:MAG: 16S rRNA (uracil(1498)-N(3))-methyltransferase [Thiotrichales bacterium]